MEGGKGMSKVEKLSELTDERYKEFWSSDKPYLVKKGEHGSKRAQIEKYWAEKKKEGKE